MCDEEKDDVSLQVNKIFCDVYNNIEKDYYKHVDKERSKLHESVIMLEEEVLTKLGDLILSEKDEDISGNEKVVLYHQSSIVKNWIKLIPMKKAVLYDNYNRKDHFKLIAEVVMDTEISKDGKKKGEKKRKTLIKFLPTIDTSEYNENSEWLYLFLINNRIVKIGGTRTGIKSRAASYLCGHHIKERGKSGSCSITNGFIYNTFEFYLNLDCKIQMMGYKLPVTEVVIDIFGIPTKIKAQTFHAYESRFLEDYKKIFGSYPILSDNCDPEYKLL